ncbi:ATP-binding cassette domain-containing protein [Roseibium sp.]|uniref:peptidase domain-containing ABC transporter n=1 Tax=Roseibium sp. TaxID=1936156 RepID=UPI003296B4F6
MTNMAAYGLPEIRDERLPLRDIHVRSLRDLSSRVGGRFEMFIAAAVSNILSLALPIAILQVYDRVIPNAALNTLALLLLGLVAVLILDAMLTLLRSRITAWRAIRLQHLASCASVKRLLDSDLKSFEQDGPGVQLQRLNQIAKLSSFQSGQGMHLLVDLPFAGIFIALIAIISVELAGVLLVVIVTLVSAAALSGMFLRRALEGRAAGDDLRHNFIIELLRGIHTIKTIGAENLMLRRYERLQSTSALFNYAVALNSAVARIVGSGTSQISIVSVAAYGGSMAMKGEISLGALSACIFLAGRTAQPLLRAMGIWARFQSVRIAHEQVEELFAIPLEESGTIDGEDIQGRVSLEHVAFSYDEEDEPVLRDVHLDIEPGELIGVTGRNGAGKTTLLWLMMGMLRPTEGRVAIDGVNVRDYSYEGLHRHIAYLPQDGVLFQGTLLDNLTLYRPELADHAAEIVEKIGLSEIVGALPDGYETEFRDNPSDGLPTGVVQRIALARAFVTVPEPKLVIFDEANSHLDAIGDSELQQMIAEITGKTTMLMVTHRPSLLSKADRTFVLRDGNLEGSVGGAKDLIEALNRDIAE